METVQSVFGVPVRLPPERWGHIERRHPELKGELGKILETVSSPDYIQEGDGGELIAIKHYSRTPLTVKYCAVVYREIDENDGFIITGYFVDRPAAWRRIIWKP